MLDKDKKEFIKKAKEEYRKIGYIECPAFNGEKVYFTDKGFTHLLRKGRELRTSDEQIKRIDILKYVADIIRNSKTFDTHRITEKQYQTNKGIINSIAHFWSFRKSISNKEISIVICQINNEPKTFLSVMYIN